MNWVITVYEDSPDKKSLETSPHAHRARQYTYKQIKIAHQKGAEERKKAEMGVESWLCIEWKLT